MTLAGRRVVVTRSGDQAGRLSELLREAGATVVEVPLISVADPLDDGAALRAALDEVVDGRQQTDWLIVTSPNGAARTAAVLGSRPIATRIAAVGRGTEAALGRPADLVPSRQVAEGLLAEFPAGPGRVLLVQGDQARDVLAPGLTDQGWEVERVTAYRNLPRFPEPAEIAAIRGADAITFASGSAVRAFVAAAGVEALPPSVVSIGPITTTAASELGVAVTATATSHDLEGLVAAVVAVLGAPAA